LLHGSVDVILAVPQLVFVLLIVIAVGLSQAPQVTRAILDVPQYPDTRQLLADPARARR